MWQLHATAASRHAAGQPSSATPQPTPPQGRQSHCQLEAHISYRDLVSHKAEGEWSKNAPFRILSVDIECQGRRVGGWAGRRVGWAAGRVGTRAGGAC